MGLTEILFIVASIVIFGFIFATKNTKYQDFRIKRPHVPPPRGTAKTPEKTAGPRRPGPGSAPKA